MAYDVSSLPPSIQHEIKNIEASGSTITEVWTHSYAKYFEVTVRGVDKNGWTFCKVVSCVNEW